MKPQLKQNILIFALALSTLLVSAATSMANLALPSISFEFSTSFSTVRWVVLVYLLAITIFSLVVGRLADKKGRRFVLILGTVVFSIGALIASLSKSFPVLIFSRVLQGVGAAALAVLPIAIVTEVMSKQKMGRTIGVLATMSAIGTAVGPSIGGFLLEEFGWRSIFTVLTTLGTLTLILSLRFVRFSEGARSQLENNFRDWIKSFYSDPLLRGHFISNLIISAVMVTTLIISPFYLMHALHLNAHQMGLVMSVGPITSIFSGTVAGYVVDRFGYNFVIRLGLLQTLIGTLSFIFLPRHFASLGFIISAILLSLGYQLFLSANSTGLMKTASTESRGMAAGALNLSRNFGLLSGTYFLAGIFDFIAMNSIQPQTKVSAIFLGFQITFLISALLIAILLIIQLKEQKRRTYEKRFVNQIH